MKSTYVFSALTSCFITLSSDLFAQNFKSEQRKLDATVNTAYKSKKLTALEYSKLQREQEIIKGTIEKAEADGVVTPDEKNRINSKLVRSRKRLAKYKTNSEVY
ncbi:hypothetical protein L0657_08085 [Dyadobacter sp. CY345]|uniref:hypothetical protein n=1 Tax=Dyadobacter sp. CY345 TaxID=2909335 RepID=UPI001F4643C8|nr:hypothetical protein [Dyadobacter sp. CY345]MCF2443911.1 hypothetical protein [Dyadobacter sp. CY345]